MARLGFFPNSYAAACFEPVSVDLHQTGTFEGRPTNWASWLCYFLMSLVKLSWKLTGNWSGVFRRWSQFGKPILSAQAIEPEPKPGPTLPNTFFQLKPTMETVDFFAALISTTLLLKEVMLGRCSPLVGEWSNQKFAKWKLTKYSKPYGHILTLPSY